MTASAFVASSTSRALRGESTSPLASTGMRIAALIAVITSDTSIAAGSCTVIGTDRMNVRMSCAMATFSTRSSWCVMAATAVFRGSGTCDTSIFQPW